MYPADHSAFDIEVDIDNTPCLLLGEEGPNPDNIASEVEEEQEEIDSDGDNVESDNDESLFELDNEAEARMHDLLMAAANEANVETTGNTARVTRSSGLKLTWNPCMNDGDVVVQENRE